MVVHKAKSKPTFLKEFWVRKLEKTFPVPPETSHSFHGLQLDMVDMVWLEQKFGIPKVILRLEGLGSEAKIATEARRAILIATVADIISA